MNGHFRIVERADQPGTFFVEINFGPFASAEDAHEEMTDLFFAIGEQLILQHESIH